MKKVIGTILFVVLTFYSIHAQVFLKRDGKKIVNGYGQEVILRSMGLGGWMLQEGYMMQTEKTVPTQHQLKKEISALIGQDNMVAFYDAWLANHCRKIDIDSLASWGFNSVRLAMHYNLYTLPVEQEPVPGENTWLEKGFILTDSLLNWCAANNIYLILDLHAAPGGQGKDEPISDYDPSKPSLWESEENRAKTIALWRKIAERYSNEPWIGGYDLINETNWDMSGNILLKQLYLSITNAIREVDTNHIIFIEGNWFANDFTGLKPPWDDNMVYSFHKYWSYNNQESIQWMLDMRDMYNIPIWCGEAGENSNVWFRNAIKLFEDNSIGWAWWPLKKVDNIRGPLIIKKSGGYQDILDYWAGSAGKPSAAAAQQALMELAENARLENCQFMPDVIDAMFRQVHTDDVIPYKAQQIPGIVYASDVDLGRNNFAYFDTDTGTYHVSAGSYSDWNMGWAARNDGIDIGWIEDTDINNSYYLGWTKTGEWVSYTVTIAGSGAYDVNFRVASEVSSGRFHLMLDDRPVSEIIQVSDTDDWQNWQDLTISNVILEEGKHVLKLFIDENEFNLSYMDFYNLSPANTVDFKLLQSRLSADGYKITASFNKKFQDDLPDLPGGFSVTVNGTPEQITGYQLDGSGRQILMTMEKFIHYTDDVYLSFSGLEIAAVDSTILAPFSNEQVDALKPSRFKIPGLIEAELFHYNNGFGIESTTDDGGGQNLGWTDEGDYVEYNIEVETAGTYSIDYRVSSESSAGKIEVMLIDELDREWLIDNVNLPVTGDWQIWQSVNKLAYLPAGNSVLRITVKSAGFNLNWINIDMVTNLKNETGLIDRFQLKQNYPNPFNPVTRISYHLKKKTDVLLEVFNVLGQKVYVLINRNQPAGVYHTDFNAQDLSSGLYYYRLKVDDFVKTRKMILIK